ncbi:MAG: nucleotidyltransferase [Lachnospiraceae bacterium]|nr:nucleotidyltransferase [Lachnospiraceae bacterium]
MNKPTLVVMAAGMGSRYGGLKQIDRLTSEGEILLDFSLYDAMMAGFERVVFVIKEENEQDFRALIDERAGRFLEVHYAFQKLDDLPEGFDVPEGRVKPWGTAHAVYSARGVIDGPFVVINADDYYGPGAFAQVYDYLESNPEGYCMVGYRLSNTMTENGSVARGVCEVAPDGHLLSVEERLQIRWDNGNVICADETGEGVMSLPADATVSMNFWGFPAAMMDALGTRFPEFLTQALAENPQKGEFFLPSVVKSLIDDEGAMVRVLTSPDRWFGVTYKEDRQTVVDSLQSMKDKGLYPEKLWK